MASPYFNQSASGLIGNYNVVSKVTTYAIGVNDGLILCSGSAFTVTLPTAVGALGKTYIIQKTDVSFTNIITIATTSSQTISGGASGTSTTLNTIGERIAVTSDNANWIAARTIPSIRTTYTPTFSAGFGTVASPAVEYWRVGQIVNVAGSVVTGTVASSAATMTLPAGLTNISLTTSLILGQWNRNSTSATNYKEGTIIMSSASSTVGFGSNELTDTVSPYTIQNGSALFSNAQKVTLFFSVAIDVWNG